MRRSAIVCVLALWVGLAGCGAGADRGPAWPKPSPVEPEDDGGESLAPRQASSVAAIEDSDDPAPSTSPASGSSAAASSASPASAQQKSEKAADAPASRELDPLTTEEIVIEIED